MIGGWFWSTMLLKSSETSQNFILFNSLAGALRSRGESCNLSVSISVKLGLPSVAAISSQEYTVTHVVRSVVKTEGEVERDNEYVVDVFRFHAKLQE